MFVSFQMFLIDVIYAARNRVMRLIITGILSEQFNIFVPDPPPEPL